MNFDLTFYWKLLLRRLPAMTAIFLLCAGLGFALSVKLPTTYSANATLLVESPQIPANLAASTVGTNASEQVEVIRRRLLTRANLIDIANENKVFADAGVIAPDEIVNRMRTATAFTSRGQPLVVSIGFEASKPDVAAAVVNRYVNLILEANVEFRTSRVSDTLSFFQQEQTRLNNELDLINQRILTFKNENADALPENLNYRLTQQTVLQERLSRLERDKTSKIEQRDTLVSIFTQTGRVQPADNVRLSPVEEELQKAQQELDNALILYSASNPKVRLIQSQVERLQAAVQAQAGSVDPASTADTQQSLYEVTLAQIESELGDFDRQIAELTTQIDELNESIAQTPRNGIALSNLQRDYSNIQNQYETTVARLAEASMGERIELSSKGQRITVVEAASVPNAPTSPNRPMVAASGVGVGLAAAAGLFVLLELLNRTVRRPAEVLSRAGITPLATIPYMETTVHRRVRRGVRILIFILVVVGVPAALWAVDTYYKPLDYLFQRALSKVGL